MRIQWFAVVLAAWLWSGDGVAGEASARAHTLSLFPLRPLPGTRWWSTPDAVAGELPSLSHPKGTVLVVEAAAGQPTPTLAEWDLATAQLFRSVALPLGAELRETRMVRAGNHIHVFASSRLNGDLLHVRLTRALKVEAQEKLGTVGGMSVATDGALVAVLWCGTREGAATPGWQLVTLDSTGTRFGATTLSSNPIYISGRPLAVLKGKVYVLLNQGVGLPPIMRLGANAHVEESQPLTETPDILSSLVAWGGRLGFLNGCWFAVVDTEWLNVQGPEPGGPYRPDRDPWCPYFEMASDDAGRLVTSKGDVVAPSLRIERHWVDAEEGCIIPLWIGASPAFLVIGNKTGSLSLVWADPSGGGAPPDK